MGNCSGGENIFRYKKAPVKSWHKRISCLQNTCATVAQANPDLFCICAMAAQVFCRHVLYLCHCCTTAFQGCFVYVQRWHRRKTGWYVVVPRLHRYFAGMRCVFAVFAQVNRIMGNVFAGWATGCFSLSASDSRHGKYSFHG
jgi:hypothetical protein